MASAGHARIACIVAALALAVLWGCQGVESAPDAKCPGGRCPVIIDKSLVAYWPLEDAGPTIADQSGNHNDGTTDGAARVRGQVGSAYSFDGLSACIGVPDSPSLEMVGADTMTMMAWVNYDGAHCLTDRDEILNKGRTYEHAVACPSSGMANDYQESIQASDDTWFWSGSTALTKDAWHHVATTWDGAEVHHYVDGAEVDTPRPQGLSFAQRTTGLGIGCRTVGPDGGTGRGDSFFSGMIDEAAVYNRALTAAEISAYYRSTK